VIEQRPDWSRKLFLPDMGLPVIKLGLIGAIADTAMGVLNSLLRQPRLQLSDVYDPCLAQAQENAQHLDAAHSPSLDGLLKRCQGVVVGDVKWMGLEPILRAIEMGRSTLILQPVLSQLNPADLVRLQEAASASRCLMMPELRYRWARSTLRLRELTATQAGAIEFMELTCAGNSGNHEELMTFDWCVNVMQSECRSVHVELGEDAVILKFRRLNREGEPVSARIHFSAAPPPGDLMIASAQMRCRHGQIFLTGEEKLDWEIDRHRISESLSQDRSASDVMFDLFGRRMAGGLVPVPEISDLVRAHEIRRACVLSRIHGRETAITQQS